MANTNKRSLLPDVLRGFAAILVVLGHCIQEGSGILFQQDTLYFQDRLYQFLYSFHMPLFMLVSGYLSFGSMQKAKTHREQFTLLKKRSFSLLMPVFLWTVLDYIRIFAANMLNGYHGQSLFTFLSSFLTSFLTNLWFLWAVFWCFFIVFIMHFYLHDRTILYVIGFLLLFFIPDGLGLGAYKYMMPYFIAAFYFREWQANKKESAVVFRLKELYQRFPWGLTILTGILFLFLFLLFDENTLIYLSGYKLIGKDVLSQLFTDFYRMLIGFAGSVFFILLWQQILKWGYSFWLLSRIGQDSMGIYILSGYLLIFGVAPLTEQIQPSYLVNMLELAAVLAASFLLTELFRYIPGIRKLVGR